MENSRLPAMLVTGGGEGVGAGVVGAGVGADDVGAGVGAGVVLH